MKRREAWLNYLSKLSFLTLAYLAATYINRSGPIVLGGYSFLWLPAGVGLGTILLFGYRYWPSIALGTILRMAIVGRPFYFSLGLAAAHGVEALLGAYLVSRVLNRDFSFTRLSHLLGFLFFGAVVATMTSPTLILLISGLDPTSRLREPVSLWLVIWTGNVMGVLLITPPVLAWRKTLADPTQRTRLIRNLPITSVAFFALWMTMQMNPMDTRGYLWVTLCMLLIVIAAALRHGVRGASVANFVVGLPLIWGAQSLVNFPPNENGLSSLLLLPSVIFVICTTSLIVGSVTQSSRDEFERFSKIFNASPMIMTFQSLEDGRFLDVNDAFVSTTGYQREEVVGKTATEIGLWIEGEHREAMRDELIRSGSFRNKEITFRMKGGETRLFRFFAETLVVSSQPGMLVVSEDCTDQRRLEGQLHQKQKMEALGSLAGGVAHDFNNLLTVILGYTEMLQVSSHLSGSDLHDLEEIQRAAESAKSLTDQLLIFGRKHHHKSRVMDLNSSLKGVEKMLRRIIGEDIRLEVKPGTTPAWVRFDPSQIEQVFLNLAVNARDAMPQGGELRITLAELTVEGPSFGQADVQSGRYFVVTVSDTGCGMDELTLSRIYDPFFTTKEPGKGTGLGLAMTYGIVRQGEGFLTVESEVGTGTTFKVYLPAIDPPQEGETREVASRRIPKRSETILLAEDQETVRDLTRKLLEQNGYRVLEATNGKQALEVAEEYEGEIDVLLTDVVMPVLGGRQLAERLLKMRPTTKVFYMSGYTDDQILQHGLDKQQRGHLRKPFTAQELLRRMNELLESE